ncbi:MAG: diaminopimelate epimerase [Gammaproteobacteria bacterium]|nr:MAG: diaminopimelate epimerase [Gammaproteobacteria bacterium]
MQLRFSKMHGLGNDFIVVDGVRQKIALDAATVRRLADRHTGIGCDQLLVVEPPPDESVDFRYRIFNADGGEVEQCGNGARCFARFARDQGLSDKTTLRVATSAGTLTLQIEDDGQVTVDMGVPELEPSRIPFTAVTRAAHYQVDTELGEITFGAVAIGNPHAVLLVDDPATAPVDTVGPLLESHPNFPRRVNVGFLGVTDRTHARLRVFERGVGETRACGSGACAAVVVGRLQGLFDPSVTVDLTGGRLVISWLGEGESVHMTGPASHVFEGVIEL